MKTSEEIKKWLKCWAITYTDECTGNCESCEYDVPMDSSVKMGAVALAYIQQLEQRLAQAERERDALMEYAKGCCETCAFVGDCAKHDPDPTSTGVWWYDDCEEWQWRGVCEENSQ